MDLRRLLRRPFVDTLYAKEARLQGKHVIVTGAGSGSLGYETAKTLARWGALVIVTTRRNSGTIVDALKSELREENIDPFISGHELDLCSTESVDLFTQWYLKHYAERLDILVNNAGIHLDLMSKWKEPNLSGDGHEIQWRTNYLGTARHRKKPGAGTITSIVLLARPRKIVTMKSRPAAYGRSGKCGLIACHN